MLIHGSQTEHGRPPRMLHLRRVARRRDEGASAVEYALLVAAIAAVVLAVAIGLASIVKDAFGTPETCLTGGGAGCPTTSATP
jgi:pilus assembly protein Flp/PilA